MNKITVLFVIIIITISLPSFTKKNIQQDNQPPIQMFLDKIEGETFEDDDFQQQILSQKLTNNSFTVNIKSGRLIFRTEVKGIAWEKFLRVETYTLKDADKYASCKFYFENNLNKIGFSNDEEFGKFDDDNFFECYIYAKDKEEFLKVIKDWENSKN